MSFLFLCPQIPYLQKCKKREILFSLSIFLSLETRPWNVNKKKFEWLKCGRVGPSSALSRLHSDMISWASWKCILCWSSKSFSGDDLSTRETSYSPLFATHDTEGSVNTTQTRVPGCTVTDAYNNFGGGGGGAMLLLLVRSVLCRKVQLLPCSVESSVSCVQRGRARRICKIY